MPYAVIGKGAVDDQAILNQPGRLVVNPTNHDLAFPYGGDYLGSMDNGLDFAPRSSVQALTCLDQRPYPYKYVWTGWEEVQLSTIFIEWNPAVVQLLFPGMTVPASLPGERRVEFPGALRPGLMSGEAVSLLFVPDEEENEDLQWALYLRKAVPAISETAILSYQFSDSTLLPLIFRAEPLEGYIPEEQEIGVIDRRRDIIL